MNGASTSTNCFHKLFPGYVRALSKYQQALPRRNALLKQLFEKGGDREQLVYWDDLVSTNGALIIEARMKATRDFEAYFKDQYQRLTGGKEEIRLEYQPSFNGSSNQKKQMDLDIEPAESPQLSYDEIRERFFQKIEGDTPGGKSGAV